MILFESQGVRYSQCSISFLYDGESKEFKSDNTKNLFKDVIDWLCDEGYEFKGDLHKKESTSRRIFTNSEVEEIVNRTTYEKRMFHNISNSGKYILFNSGVKQLFGDLVKMLINFGINESSIKIEGVGDKPKIKKFADIDDESEKSKESIADSSGYAENPFIQAICVLGESGAGKSHTIETILENEGHEFEFIIPTAATTGLLAQFSPTKSGYVPSRLGKMVINAAKNKGKLYTAVFDEMHKSNVIEMINDELLQAISIHRNNGVRFISLDDDTAELYNVPELEKKRGNIILPDNFGFIFISSKPRVIANNPDFFNRVDIIRLKHFEEESVESSDELLSLVLDPGDKSELISTRND